MHQAQLHAFILDDHISVVDLGGVGLKGDANAPPFGGIFVYITARVHEMIMQQWHAAHNNNQAQLHTHVSVPY